MVERITERYWERYRRPTMIAETAGRGRVTRRARWLQESVQSVRNLRERGVPVDDYRALAAGGTKAAGSRPVGAGHAQPGAPQAHVRQPRTP